MLGLWDLVYPDHRRAEGARRCWGSMAQAMREVPQRSGAARIYQKVSFMEQCLECKGDLESAEGCSILLACVLCGRIYRTDRAPGLTYTGVRYAESKDYMTLLTGHKSTKR